MSKNPVERRIELLGDAWMQASEDPALRLLVWRVPANAARLLAAFFEAQKHPGDWNAPDYFLRLDTPFDTGFGYSRALKQALHASYLGSQSALREQGVELGWPGPGPSHPDSALGVVEVLDSFAAYHQVHLRYLAVVLEPERTTSADAFARWMDAALAAAPSPALRLVLVDTHEDPRWQPLLERHAAIARRIEPPLDMFDIARETAAQSGGAGPAVAYRQMLSDLMTVLERGSATQLAQRVERPLALAQRHGWPDQQVVLNMMLAGGWLKEKQYPQAIASYRQSRECGLQALAVQHPAARDLVMQSWYGEAGTWFVAGQPGRAAETYVAAAKAAAEIPNPMFVIEGYRMAAFCLAQDGQREAARAHGLEAIRAAKPLPPADRRTTTLPQTLQDLLLLQDRPRAQKLEQCAASYLQAVAALHAQAEAQAAQLGPRPDSAQLDRIESALHAGFEQAFHRVAQERERLIQGGDAFFRKVVAVGRDFLHPTWNGLPDIRHPLDNAIPAWTEPPATQPLPDPSALTGSAAACDAQAPGRSGLTEATA
ncbi:hypothetical protein [Xanthomonas translucens]|uniref:hypothetical protein n=1 Tax=Xanthomonas campestris pv. translucens TaxID=343 RepID=UPI00071E8106|nr:hypothetical protein [Xanthomonas translucens]QEN94414.1 hypothetical protein F0H33_14420 [Xanthomonas translucens pv. undulosa]